LNSVNIYATLQPIPKTPKIIKNGKIPKNEQNLLKNGKKDRKHANSKTDKIQKRAKTSENGRIQKRANSQKGQKLVKMAKFQKPANSKEGKKTKTAKSSRKRPNSKNGQIRKQAKRAKTGKFKQRANSKTVKKSKNGQKQRKRIVLTSSNPPKMPADIVSSDLLPPYISEQFFDFLWRHRFRTFCKSLIALLFACP
jgi:hypothetical protein